MKKEKVVLIPKETLVKGFKISSFLAAIAMKIMKISKLNRFYRSLLPVKTHVELFQKALKARKITIDVDLEFIERLPEGPFITLSNHAFGLLDGMILIALIREKYSGYKITANFLIAQLQPLKEVFIPVNPMEGADYIPMGGTKEVLKILEEGHPVGLFPAGGVATYYKGSKEIIDKPWMISVFQLINKAKVPVLPVYFWGTNSFLFHFLGRIHPHWRTFRLFKEFFKKKNTTIRMEVGRIISPDEYNRISDLEELSEFFRSKVFNLRWK
ncbi:MAG TPA: lysophospholipid acyltransferase family protein [candidate division Zixibacteria bacterium]|nr:lysophospholipid acyltransferase family protein [candidate division Zixibacteria bacterium]